MIRRRGGGGGGGEETVYVRRVVVLRPKWIRDETQRVLHRVLHRVGQNVVPLPHLLPGGGGGTSRAMPSVSPDPRNPRNCRRQSLVYDCRTARHLRPERGAL